MSPEVNAKELLAAVERAKSAIQNRIAGLKAQRVLIDEELAALGEAQEKAPARKRKPGRPLGSRNRTPREAQGSVGVQQVAAIPAPVPISWTDLGSDPKEPR